MEHPTKYSSAKAAKAVGIAKSTMSEHIHSGKIAAKKLDTGGFEIDASELARVFPDAFMRHITQTGSETPEPNGSETPEPVGRTPLDVAALRIEIKMLREMLDRSDTDRDSERRAASNTIEDLRARLDQEGAERRQLNAQLLTYQQPPASPPPAKPAMHAKRGIFAGLFRRAG